MRKAVQADPTSIVHIKEFRDLLTHEYGVVRGLKDFYRYVPEDVIACTEADLIQDFGTLHKLARTKGPASECAAYSLVTPLRHTADELAVLVRVTSRPFSSNFALSVSRQFEVQDRWQAAADVLRASLKNELTPRQRASLSAHLGYVLQMGRLPGARAYQMAMDAAVKRSPYPASPYWYAADRPIALTEPGRAEEMIKAAKLAARYDAFASCSHSLTALVNALIDAGDMKQAAQISPDAIACADKSPNIELQTRTRILYGRALVKGGDAKRGIPIIKSAARWAIPSGYNYNIADMYHNLAHAYETLGDRVNAKAEAARFVESARKLTNSPLRIVSLRDAGIIFWDSGDRFQARRYFNEMVSRVDEEGHDHYWAGEFYERTGDLGKARRYYQAALRTRGDSARKTAALTRIYLAVGSIDSAAGAASLHDGLPQTPEEVPLMPVIQAARGDYISALDQARRWADLQRARGNIAGSINAELQVAELAQSSGDKAVMRSAASAVLALARSDSVVDARARAYAFLGDFKPALQLARRAGNPGVLADVWAAYAAMLSDPRAALDSALAARKRTADRFEHSFDRVRFRNPVAQLLELNAARAIRDRRADDLYQWSVRRKAERAGMTALREIQSRLPTAAALIDYTVTDSAVAALVITRRNARVVPLTVRRTDIRRLVDDLRRPTAARLGTIDLARAHYNYGAARGAYDVLLRPLQPLIAGKTELRISADDALHFIPFDALLDGSDYVIERAAIAYLPSPDAAMPIAPVSLTRTVFIAGNAPGVAQEAAALKQLLPNARISKPVSFEQLRTTATNATVLHLAAHAYADAANPLSAFVELAPARLVINEIEQLRLNAELVVLTACETMYGKLYAGAPFGLAAAFGAAGAKAVVATLWPVGANSAVFTKGFYAALQRGSSPTSALREAKLQLKTESDNPLLWAPFVLNASAPGVR